MLRSFLLRNFEFGHHLIPEELEHVNACRINKVYADESTVNKIYGIVQKTKLKSSLFLLNSNMVKLMDVVLMIGRSFNWKIAFVYMMFLSLNSNRFIS